MFSDHQFSAAVFIGGMAGVVDEFEMIDRLQPNARKLPVASTGGGSVDVAERMKVVTPDLLGDLDYVALFHRHLEISFRENRYRRPELQPNAIADRLWNPDQ
jgi:hypothetical protein